MRVYIGLVKEEDEYLPHIFRRSAFVILLYVLLQRMMITCYVFGPEIVTKVYSNESAYSRVPNSLEYLPHHGQRMMRYIDSNAKFWSTCEIL